MKRQGRRKLSTEISFLTIFSAISTLLVLGCAFLILFVFFFSRRARDDVHYYLDNTLQQFQNQIQYVKDGAISIRHNVVMDDFFNKNHFNQEKTEDQLTYCMDLFSQRNMVHENTPFVVHVYVFNNKGDFVRSSYYPMTLTAAGQLDQSYQTLYQQFNATGQPYAWYSGEENTDLCFRIFDGEMKKIGACIVSVQNRAMEAVFSGVGKYRDGCWLVTDGNGLILNSSGTDGQVAGLSEIMYNTESHARLDGKNALCSRLPGSFGIQTAMAVGQSNIYSDLKSLTVSFLLVLMIVMAMVSVLVLGVSYRMTHPLREMVKEIDSFGQKNLAVRMQDFPIQEFHDISVVFNDMADRINYLVTQIYEKELLATRAQVKYLQAQINPHFQFNILAMLSIRAKKTGDEELYQGLRAFSKLIQGKIFREKKIKIALSEEMELVRFYLYLQSSRYRDKLSYEIIYGGEDVGTCLIPRLLIEPLVENAVSHGLEPKSGEGHIRIEVREQDDRLHIVVEDDGVGFEPEENLPDCPTVEQSEHTRTGLANTRRLLDILYEGNHQMTIHGAPGQGTRVEIILPVERGTEDVERDSGR